MWRIIALFLGGVAYLKLRAFMTGGKIAPDYVRKVDMHGTGCVAALLPVVTSAVVTRQSKKVGSL